MDWTHRFRVRKHIHRKIKQHSPKGVHKAKRLFAFKYPKLILLIILIILAFLLFRHPLISNAILGLNKLNYLGFFIAGILLAFGFSAPFAIGFFIIAQPGNLFLATLIGGFGGMVGDMSIFKIIKFSFMNEFRELEKTRVIKAIENTIKHNKHILIKHYLLYVFAGILIATPLPDEIGVSMLAGLTTVNPKKLAIISFFLHSLAIFLILCFSFSL